MWYLQAKENSITPKTMMREAMTKQAGALDQLWGSLSQNGISDRLGLRHKGDLQTFMGDQRFLEDLGKETSNIPAEAERLRIQKSYSNFNAGRILGEEMRKALENAKQTRGPEAEPSVAEMRAARQRANDRILNETTAEGLGLPKEFVVGKRGKLRSLKPQKQRRTPLIKDIAMAPQPIEDQDLANVVSQIYRDELVKIRSEVKARFDQGLAASPEPTAADMRKAVLNANQRVKEMGLDHIVFEVGSRGRFPSGGPRLTERIENEKHFYARRKAREKAQNLGLEPPIDVDPETPVVLPNPFNLDPNDNQLPQETEIEQREKQKFQQGATGKRAQMAYPHRPPLHNHCRCSIVDLGMAQQWLTAGDDAVCKKCIKHSEIFNSMKPV